MTHSLLPNQTPPMHFIAPPQLSGSSLLKALLLVVAILSPLLFYFDTAESIVAIWNRSETFTHQYAIVPISLWLIWQRRKNLASMPLVPYWPALPVLAFCGFAWLLGNLAGVQIVQQYAFVAMLILTAISLAGSRISKSIAFPLFFILLAVPFGEVFIGPLMDFTANFIVAALQATGIPVLREGNSFTIPSGRWSVVEACSGVRYLIASVTLGLLYAYLTYRSRLRQAIFVLIAVIVPIIANGLRGYMIVMIGHLSSMKYAVGVDHLIYGWLFFGLVMFLMFWGGSYWREDPAPSIKSTSTDVAAAPAVATGKFLTYVACAIACIAVWPIWAKHMEQADMAVGHADLSQMHIRWQDAQPFTTWEPSFYPSDAELYRFFQHDSQAVGLSVHYYRKQNPGSMLISTFNRMLPSKDPVWNEVGNAVRAESIAGRTLTVREETIQSENGSLLIWHWYWIDGQYAENDYIGKLLQAKERLITGSDDGAAVVIFAPYVDKPDEARRALNAFLVENLPPLEATLASNGRK